MKIQTKNLVEAIKHLSGSSEFKNTSSDQVCIMFNFAETLNLTALYGKEIDTDEFSEKGEKLLDALEKNKETGAILVYEYADHIMRWSKEF